MPKLSQRRMHWERSAERGISSEEVVVVGDFDNDIDMIKWAGKGVAMGNGNENAKRVADFITETNDNLGVAQVIGRFFADITQ